MPAGLHCIHDVENPRAAEDLVDIVAVHDLGEDYIETWTHPQSGSNWLREFLPQRIHNARVLAFAYEASVSSFLGSKGASYIQRTAETLVQELYADRRLRGTLARPIVFICHGLGGLVVKKALAYSATRVAQKVEHLFDTFVSTFAIIFFGTPNGHTRVSSWNRTKPGLADNSRLPSINGVISDDHIDQDSLIPRSIDAEFAPHYNAFRLYFFWEGLETSFNGDLAFIVDSTSATIAPDNVEKAGIHADHYGMVKFDCEENSSCRTVIEALSRYCYDAGNIVTHRWKRAKQRLDEIRAGEAWELTGAFTFDVHAESEIHTRPREPSVFATTSFCPPVDAVGDFVGREDKLNVIRDKFFPDGRPFDALHRKSLVVHGMGGSGKTQLCAKFAAEYQTRYTSVFTIHAASPKTIEDSFCNIALEGSLHPTENAGRHFLNQQKFPWLLIIDNADDLSLILDDLFPKVGAAHILITTRNPKFKKHGSLGSIKLHGLAETEALKLLLSRAEIPEPWDVPTTEHGNLIAKSLGYLALALIHAGNCICQQICTLGDYLHLHSASRREIQLRSHEGTEHSSRPRDDVDMVAAVYSAFDVSFEHLQTRNNVKSHDAIELLRVCAFYHFERIPERIFTRAITNRRADTKDKSRSPFSPWLEYLMLLPSQKRLPELLIGSSDSLNESRATWALDELQSLSLISRNAKEGTFSMHPLVHQWARDKLTGKEKAVWVSVSLNTLLESVVLQLGDSKRSDKNDAKADGAFYQSILPHLNACLEEHQSPLSSSTAAASKFSVLLSMLYDPNRQETIRAELLNAGKCAVVFGERGQFSRAAVYLQEVKTTLLHLQGLYSERTLLVMLYLSNLYWGLGRLEESIELLNRVVQARSYVNGPDHEQTLIAMSSLGRAYWLHGDYKQSLTVLECATEKMQEVLGEDHPQTLAALDNYGVTLGSWYRFEESLAVHKRVLDSRETSLGSDDPDTLSTKMNLAMALLDLGQLTEAEGLMRTVYRIRQQQLGKEHPWTLWALCYLTKIYIEQGSVVEAENLLTWGIQAGIRSLSKDHLGVLLGQGCLALAYARQGKLEQAESLTLETLVSLRKSRGIAHPDCVFCQLKLAELYRRQDRISDAIKQCEEALRSADLRITREHPLAVRTLKLLEELRSSQHSLEDAKGKQFDIANTDEDEPRRGVRHSETW